MSNLTHFFASLSEFRSSSPQILCGDILKEVKAIERSILEHGLICPLVVTKTGRHIVVLDGRKRLAALRRLEFRGDLPHEALNVPYIVLSSRECEAQGPDFIKAPTHSADIIDIRVLDAAHAA